MSQPGVGVMLHHLSSSAAEADRTVEAARGKEITEVSLRTGEITDALILGFADGSKIRLSDEGQSCCEHRYMTCDDELSYYVGSRLVGVTVKEITEESGEYDAVTEVAFLEVTTDRGAFSVATHNEHNGYYGGFALCIGQERKPKG